MLLDLTPLNTLFGLQLPLVLVAVAANFFPTPLLAPLPANPARPSPFERLVRIRFDIPERVLHAGRLIVLFNLILASEIAAIAYVGLFIDWHPTPVFYGLGFALYLLRRASRRAASTPAH